jgi:hypothetical protein
MFNSVFPVKPFPECCSSESGNPINKFAGSRPAAGYFLCAAKESNQRNAAPPRWFFASQGTSLPPVKKRGASQLDLARDTVRPALRDSDRGSPTAPRFLTFRSAAQKGMTLQRVLYYQHVQASINQIIRVLVHRRNEFGRTSLTSAHQI